MLKKVMNKRWLDWTIAIIVVVFIGLMWAIQDYSIEQDYSFASGDISYSIRLHRSAH